MSSGNVRARRYAQAVFEIALAKKELDIWQADLGKIEGFSKDAAISAFLESPKVPFSEKSKIISGLLTGANPMVLNLVYLLVSKGKFSLAGAISDDYRRLLNSYRGISSADVSTATPLSEEDKLKIEKMLGGVTGKKIVLKTVVQPKLLGGIVARIDGKLLDGSTVTRLAALKSELAGLSA